MPPNLNIYSITNQRDESTINRFIDTYVDRGKSENRENEELMLIPLIASKNHLDLNEYDWEPSRTLTHNIKRGLDYPRRAFTVYLEPKDLELDSVILSFTTDDQLILGLAIDDEGMRPENKQRAKKLLDELMHDFNCHAGLIVVDIPPPTDQVEFLSLSSSAFNVLFKSVESYNKNGV